MRSYTVQVSTIDGKFVGESVIVNKLPLCKRVVDYNDDGDHTHVVNIVNLAGEDIEFGICDYDGEFVEKYAPAPDVFANHAIRMVAI